MVRMQRDEIQDYVRRHAQETLALLKTLAAIPAPSFQEGRRAEFVRDWLTAQGAEGVFKDGVGNVLFLYGTGASPEIAGERGSGRKEQDLTVVSAHMDVVFPDQDALPVRECDGRLYAPGIGDNTANLVNLMMAVKFLLEHPNDAGGRILFAANVCEEGLGNLRGSRAILESYGKRIRAWISFDLYLDKLCDRAVGSQRYEITMRTQGGHSYGDFGRTSAIAAASELVSRLYRQEVPAEAKTTFNVGEMRGGTSVNVIASEAVLRYEFRSESAPCMRQMEEKLQTLLDQTAQETGAEMTVQLLGVRPGNGDVDERRQAALRERCLGVLGQYADGGVNISAASTDCNIPLSAGIPAVCVGTVRGALLHTRDEWIDMASMQSGQAAAIEILLGCLTKEI